MRCAYQGLSRQEQPVAQQQGGRYTCIAQAFVLAEKHGANQKYRARKCQASLTAMHPIMGVLKLSGKALIRGRAHSSRCCTGRRP